MVSWEPPVFKDADPGELGIFPARTASAEPWDDYVPRDVDPRLAAAHRTARLLLIFGGPRAGKTRTAAEITRRVLAAALVLVPTGPDGLRLFLEIEPPLAAEQAVLWLDGLQRFSTVLDGKTLNQLRATDHEEGKSPNAAGFGARITVVATVREATWDRLLASDGADGEFAKAVAGRARAFAVPTELSSSEQNAAREIYPDAELAQGIGAVGERESRAGPGGKIKQAGRGGS